MRLLALFGFLFLSSFAHATNYEVKIATLKNYGFPLALQDGTIAVIGNTDVSLKYLAQVNTNGNLLNSIYLGDKFVRGCAPVSYGNKVVVHDRGGQRLLIVDMTTKKVITVPHIDGGNIPYGCMAVANDNIVISLQRGDGGGNTNYFVDLSGAVISTNTLFRFASG